MPGVERVPIETWRPEREGWWWAIPFVVVLGAWFTGVGRALIGAVQDGELFDIGLWSAMFLFGVALVLLGPVRHRTSGLEIRRDGLTVASFGRRRRIPWAELARVEIEDIDFPSFRGRGPCVVLVLTDRRRVHLWVTEQSKWRYDDRVAALQERADQLRAIRRECQAADG